MLRGLMLAALLIGGVAQDSVAATETADTVIQRYIAARGGREALAAIHTLVYRDGLYSEPGYTGAGHAAMTMMRPYYKLVGDPTADPDLMEGYEGAAWEWYPNPGFVVRTVGAASEAARHGADIDGPFVDYAAKGHSVAYLGLVEINGRPAHRIRLTLLDGIVEDSFFDAETDLLVANRDASPIHAFGAAVETETRIGDYREIAGVLVPHRYTETVIADGSIRSSMQWQRIEANVDVPLAWFSPPEFERSPIATLIEQIYFQRADVSAMQWTYRRFRLAHPDLVTADAAQIAGYQVLKMGQVASAIAISEWNARDYPDAPNAAFSLGRAYAAAHRMADARAEFQHALRLDPEHARAARALADLEAVDHGS